MLDTIDPRQVCGVSIGFQKKSKCVLGAMVSFSKEVNVRVFVDRTDELSLTLAIELLNKRKAESTASTPTLESRSI